MRLYVYDCVIVYESDCMCVRLYVNVCVWLYFCVGWVIVYVWLCDYVWLAVYVRLCVIVCICLTVCISMCVCVCVFVRTPTCAGFPCRLEERWIPWCWSHQGMGVLGAANWTRCSVRTVLTLNCWATSLAPSFSLLGSNILATISRTFFQKSTMHIWVSAWPILEW